MEGIVRIRLQEGAVSLIHSVIAENVIGKPMIVVAADHSTFFSQLQYLKIHARRVWMIHAAVKQITKQIQVIVLFEIHFFQQFHEPPAVVMYIGNNIVHPKSPFLSQLSCLLLQSSKLSLSAHFFQNGFPACVLACPVSKIFPLVLLVPDPGLLMLASWNV